MKKIVKFTIKSGYFIVAMVIAFGLGFSIAHTCTMTAPNKGAIMDAIVEHFTKPSEEEMTEKARRKFKNFVIDKHNGYFIKDTYNYIEW